MRLKITLLAVFVVGNLLFKWTDSFALREVPPGSVQNLSGKIQQENSLKREVIQRQKTSENMVERHTPRTLPKSYPMPRKGELQNTGRGTASPFYQRLPFARESLKTVSGYSSLETKAQTRVQEKKKNIKATTALAIILVLILLGGILFLWKRVSVPSDKGSTFVFVALMVVILVIIGGTLSFLSQYEATKKNKSKKESEALYIADGGIEKAIWEINRNKEYAGEQNTQLGTGSYTVAVSTPPGNPAQRQIISLGEINNVKRKIKVVAEQVSGDITVNGALSSGGDVNIGGNASVVGGTLIGVLVPVGNSVNTFGGGTITGSPPTGNGVFPTLEEVFGLTESELKSAATAKYQDPPNDANCSGITWIDENFKVSSNGWSGDGILIVNGDFEITGGIFKGVIYVLGTFKMAGNATIQGALLTQSTADVSSVTGTASISYDAAVIDEVKKVYPFKIISWQEMRN